MSTPSRPIERTRPPLALVTAQVQQQSVEELVAIYLRFRLNGKALSPSRLAGIQRALGSFAVVVGPTPIDEDAVQRWLRSRSSLAATTIYDEFCVVRACVTWLGERRFISPIRWESSTWPSSSRKRSLKKVSSEALEPVSAFGEYLHGIGLSQRSVTEYVREVARAREWLAEQGHDLARVPPSVVATYAQSRPASWSTRKMIRAALAHYWAMIDRRDAPSGAIRVPPKPRGHCRALDEGDSRILADAARARGDDAGLATCLMLYGGLRRNEVATLTWECFDASLDWMTIQGKFGVEATIPVHPRLRAMLADKGRGEGFVFPGRYPGAPSASHRIYHWVRTVAEEAGVPDVAPHRLRHVAIATVNDQTGDLRATQDFARHADPRCTAMYSRTTRRRLSAAVAAIDY